MADEEWKKRLNDSGYKNWLKVSLALIESKEALHDFTKNVIVAVHHDIKTRLGSGVCTKTSACNTRKRGSSAPTCPTCTNWVTEIKKINGGRLVWKNTDPKIWHNTPWEIAKCFMNEQGSKTNAAANTGPDKTDLSGMLNVLVNCKEFKLNHLKGKKLPEDVRKVRNDLMHCATMSFSDAEMQNMVDRVIALLEDDKVLKNFKICQDKVELIKSLRDNEFELKPKDEAVCIETALETHTLAAESGETIDENMMSLYDKLTKLIRGNKDLESKFDENVRKIDEKLENMKQDSDAKFEKVHLDFGELKGKVEFLEKQFASGRTMATSSVLGHDEIKTFYKNVLQRYAQKKKLDLPKYIKSDEVEGGKFVSTVLIDGKEYRSKEAKQSKKEAEQSAAEEALRSLGNEDSELSNENNESPSTEHQAMDSESPQTTDKLNYKNLLQERAQKQKIPNPIYNDKKTDAGFLFEVMYDGNWYSPDISPQNRKVVAQQKAAHFVLAVLDSGEERPELTSNNASPSRPNDASDVEGKEVDPTKNASKRFKVILNEHVQKITKGQLPDYKVEKNSDGKFICKVTVFGEVYESPSGMNSISDAKESAASEAFKILQLAEAVPGNSPRAAHLSAEKEQTPAIEPTSDEIGGTPQECSTDETTSAIASTSSTSPPSVDRPDGKTYKSMLNEHAQKMGAKPPDYEDIPGRDENGKEFRSKVKILDKTFECVGTHSSKKYSKEMAAMEAMKYFNGLSTENSFETNDDTSAVSPLDSGKMEPGNLSPGTEAKETTTSVISTVTSEVGSPFSVEGTEVPSSEIPKPQLEEASCVETVEPPRKTGSADGQQMPTPTQKTQPNFKNALQEYVQKQKLDQGFRYAPSTQDPSTKEYLSKVFVGKRCFKGKQPKAKVKEAEKHVAQIAMDTLEGRSGKPNSRSEQLLNAFHTGLGFPTFPKYEEATCNDEKKFIVEVKVKKKYELLCKDTKAKKKDVEIWLAEQAVKLLEEEKRITQAQENAKSRLNLFLQSQDGDSKLNYDVQGDPGKFSGGLCFYAVDVYESLTPQPTKEEAITSAAMSACNSMDLI